MVILFLYSIKHLFVVHVALSNSSNQIYHGKMYDMSSNVLCFSTHSERRLRKWIQIWSKNCNLFILCILKGIVRYLIKMSQPYSNLHRFVHQVDTKTFTKIIDLNGSMAKDINYLQHSIKITVKIAQYKLSAYYLIYTTF